MRGALHTEWLIAGAEARRGKHPGREIKGDWLPATSSSQEESGGESIFLHNKLFLGGKGRTPPSVQRRVSGRAGHACGGEVTHPVGFGGQQLASQRGSCR